MKQKVPRAGSYAIHTECEPPDYISAMPGSINNINFAKLQSLCVDNAVCPVVLQ